MKYLYPAIFTAEKDGGYSVNFPDFESCSTSADSLSEGVEMAADVLCLTLYGMEEESKEVPAASDIKSVSTADNEFVTLIPCDTIEYRKFYDNKAVKKTLTIPSWLNTIAERENVNFSATLQDALKEHLNLN